MAAPLLLLAAAPARAASEDDAPVAITVYPITEVSLSGSPGTLNVNSAVAGYQPDAATNSASTWNISTNNAAMKMVGRIDSAMPAGLTLEVSLQAPGGATGLGYQTLGTASTDLVSGIGRGFASGLTINYRLTATVDAATGPGGRTVTFSLVSE